MNPEDDKDALIEELTEEVHRLRGVISRITPSIETLLKHRGFDIFKKDSPDDLLLPSAVHIDKYYNALKRYSFRLFLRDVIKQQEGFELQDVARYATQDVTKDYIDYLIDIGLLESHEDGIFRLSTTPLRSFGPTLEWFVAETLRREFSAETIRNASFRRPGAGGDYDIIAKVENAIVYVEAKSSPPKQIYQKEIDSFLKRRDELGPDISIFVMDTELRMKDKIVPFFEEAVKSAEAVKRMEKELFIILPGTYIINAKDSLQGNLKKVLQDFFRRIK